MTYYDVLAELQENGDISEEIVDWVRKTNDLGHEMREKLEEEGQNDALVVEWLQHVDGRIGAEMKWKYYGIFCGKGEDRAVRVVMQNGLSFAAIFMYRHEAEHVLQSYHSVGGMEGAYVDEIEL